jgi:uncharacterized protein
MKVKELTDKEIMRILKEHKDILREYEVERIGLFGSYVSGEQGENSDIDFLVEFKKPNFDNFMNLASYLEDLFGRKVEILTPVGIESIRIKEIKEKIKRSVIYV